MECEDLDLDAILCHMKFDLPLMLPDQQFKR
jgi:hypothetical protein